MISYGGTEASCTCCGPTHTPFFNPPLPVNTVDITDLNRADRRAVLAIAKRYGWKVIDKRGTA